MRHTCLALGTLHGACASLGLAQTSIRHEARITQRLAVTVAQIVDGLQTLATGYRSHSIAAAWASAHAGQRTCAVARAALRHVMVGTQ